MFAPTTSNQYYTIGSSQGNLATQEIKAIQTGKEEAKLFLFENDIILYIETPREPTKNWTYLQATIKQTKNSKRWQACREIGTLFIAVGNVKGYSYVGNYPVSPWKF